MYIHINLKLIKITTIHNTKIKNIKTQKIQKDTLDSLYNILTIKIYLKCYETNNAF